MTNLSDAVGATTSHRPSAVTPNPARGKFWLIGPVVLLTLIVAWVAQHERLYTPGSRLGYYLGVVGGIMMLTLLLYPLRKHVRFLQVAGPIRHWFKIHMVFGILGPLLIVVHSAFGIGSLNAAVAMGCMLLVAGSGVIGRFIYTRIHHGLYGRKASVQEMQTDLGIHTTEMHSRFHFAPAVEGRLRDFGEIVGHGSASFRLSAWQFLTLGLRARHVRYQCRRDLRRILGAHAAKRQWDRAKLRQRLAAADSMIRNYLDAVCRTAQFGVYERLFSLWHVLHVPFVFMLVVSGVVHVIAVHMY